MARDHHYYVYILASTIGGTLYIGVTNDLVSRVSQHRLKQTPGFTRKYGVVRLVWYEPHTDINEAIRREKRLKRWNRPWKIQLIEENNPDWVDLFPALASPEDTGLSGQAGQ